MKDFVTIAYSSEVYQCANCSSDTLHVQDTRDKAAQYSGKEKKCLFKWVQVHLPS